MAQCCVFDKQSVDPFHCDLINQAPLIPKLRGQFAEFLNKVSLIRLSIYTIPPVLVLVRTGQRACMVFLATCISERGWINPPCQSFRLVQHSRRFTCLHMLVRHENIHSLSITFAFRLKFRLRLTLGRISLPRNPWEFGGEVFHFPNRY